MELNATHTHYTEVEMESYCEIKFIEWYLASLFKRFVDSIAFHNVFFFVSAVVL